jgi:iron complex outermembrane receptor protein
MSNRNFIPMAAFVCTALAGAPTFAAETDTQATNSQEAVELGAIVVTARKREESLRDVPESIAAFSDGAMAVRGIETINDLARQTPSLSLSERQNHVPNVVLRGIGSYGFVEGVGFYIDDVQNYTDKTMRLEDLERVEILKGPQGTLFGGSSLAGAVRYISKRPKFDPSAEFKGDLGGRSYQSAYASGNVPLGDTMAARASGYYTHDNGFNGDSNLNTSTSEMREYGLRGQLLYAPDDRLTVLLTARYRDFDGAYAAYAKQNSVDRVNSRTALTFKPNYRTKTAGAVLQVDYDAGPIDITSISSFTRQKTDYVVDGDYSPAAAVRGQADGRPGKVYTQELRFTSDPSESFDWIVGLYASRRENVGGQVAPLNITAGPATIAPYVDLSSRQTEYAVFGSGNLRFGDFTLTAGARLMRTIFKQHTIVSQGRPVTTNSRLTVADTIVLPKVSLAYKIEGGTLLYASIAEGYEPGKVDNSASPPATYKPETDWTYEVGIKGNLGSTVYYEAAAFYIDSRRRQGESIVSLAGSIPTKRVTNIGDATSVGAEATVRWQPVQALALDGGVGYLDAEWDDNATFNGASIAGRQIPNASRWTLNLGATYTVALSDSLDLSLHADGAYKSSYPWQLSYRPISNVNPAYWLANARVALTSASGDWELAARVDNLFNERYFTEFFPEQFGAQAADGTCVGCHLAATGTGRRLVVSVSAKF